jgi:hypothetical protein
MKESSGLHQSRRKTHPFYHKEGQRRSAAWRDFILTPIEEILISGLSKFESDADNDLTIHMLSNSQSR